MAERSKYHTKHYEELLDYLKTVPGQHLTAADISRHFRDAASPIGTATIYRQLERMVGEGIVAKYVIDENSSACFEYLDPEAHCHHEHTSCFHCKCEKCGALIHLECHDIEALAGHLSEHHGFTLDPYRTVFYGVCENCRNAG